MRSVSTVLFSLLLCKASIFAGSDDRPVFYRGVNLAGQAIQIDEQPWLAGDDPSIVVHGNAFENQNVALTPITDPARASMIRSSRWGSNLDVEIRNVAPGWYQLFIYVWEDNQTASFDLYINDKIVHKNFQSGAAGAWHRLGPFPIQVAHDVVKVSARGGDANVSGIELWAGSGDVSIASLNGFATNPNTEQLAFFEQKIRPLLINRCYECHSAESTELGGGLLLDSQRGLLVGGDNGLPVLPNSPEQSTLLKAVSYSEASLQMPPDAQLSQDEVADLRHWISMGAPDPRNEDTVAKYRKLTAIDWDDARDFWSLQPITKPKVPLVSQEGWASNPIDQFILSSMESHELEPVGTSGRETLIRRATYDLTGLPPTPEEIDVFVNDELPDAYPQLVDRLLASNHYGERWGRYWLDLVRYSDTAGDNSDFPIPQMVLYRDWVIRAFNRDLPYDQFVRQQLAGDLISSTSVEDKYEKLIATGYIANSRRFGSRVDDYPQHLTIEDTIDNVGRVFLGATINCARCHDHKFDPFTAADYYALYGIFSSTQYPWPGIELEQKQRDLIPLADESTVFEAMKSRRIEQLRLDGIVQDLERQLNGAGKDTPAWNILDTQFNDAKKVAEAHAKSSLPFDNAYAVCDANQIQDAAIQLKGNPLKLGETIPRRFLSVLGGQPLEKENFSSGRLQLADWIMDATNPLATRVIVNRVWLSHFGKGLVPTPNDFGRQGQRPSHPELLNWLAISFRESGYSIKVLHKQIMLSSVYQTASQTNGFSTESDPTNVWLSSFPRRRLDAESIRDTLLMLGGTLNLAPGGSHPFPPQSDWKFTQHNPFKATYESDHRSVYLMTQRTQRHPFLAIFDGPDPSVSTPQRLTSTTPIQSLYFLNDPTVHNQAARFASRILASGEDDRSRIRFAFRHAIGRDASENEAKQLIEFIRISKSLPVNAGSDLAIKGPWEAIVRVIFRLNEFVYVD